MPRPIVLGVCAMEKKSLSKSMKELLQNFDPSEFQVVIFEEQVIFEKPVQEWPIVDALISFYSTGFPQDKAEEYVKLRKPFLVNDLVSQRLLLDRRKVYQICQKNNIPVPRHIVVNRDGDANFEQNGNRLIEEDGYVEIDGQRILKPFVEKPVDAEDHNIFIYYPRSVGGGRKELFRKIGDRSSEYYPDRDRVRRDGSFMYEEYLTTEGTDVKVYAVTGAYAYAEGRKSPTMDGKVLRDENQMEVRYPVMLSTFEKELCMKICLSFSQRVCGFDMLRSEGKTYVCDVNGWSFVKRSARHFKDTAQLLSVLLKTSLGRPDLLQKGLTEGVEEEEEEEDTGKGIKPGTKHEELRAVFAVLRHGDRTPKQKLKMKTSSRKLLDLLKGKSEVKLKTAAELGNVLKIINELLEEYPPRPNTPSTPSGGSRTSLDSPRFNEDEDIEELLLQARAVLEIGGSFKGINRKVQLKASKFEGNDPVEATMIMKWGGVLTPDGRRHAEELGRAFRERLYPGVDGLLRLHSTYRHDLKIYSSDEGRVQVSAAAFAKGLLDLEGHLTPILASLVRKGDDVNLILDDASAASEDMENAKARLKTALFAPKGDDSRESAFAPASVKRAVSNIKDDIPGIMQKLYIDIKSLAQQLKNLVRAIRQNAPRPTRGSAAATVHVRKARVGDTLEISSDGGSAAASLGMIMSTDNSSSTSLDRGDGAITLPDMIQLSYGRWEKLARDIYKVKTNTFDVSKIPDVYDAAKHDIVHNKELLGLVPKHLHLVYHYSKNLADIVIPQEYGDTPENKLVIGSKIARNLIRKIQEKAVRLGESAPVKGEHNDDPDQQHRLDTRFAKESGIKSTDRRVLTRIYFTSESHMHSLLNVLRFAHVSNDVAKPAAESLKECEELDELDFLSHIIFRLLEITEVDGSTKFVVRISFSSGVRLNTVFDEKTKTLQKVEVGVPTKTSSVKGLVVKQLPPAAPLITLFKDLDLSDFERLMQSAQN